MHMRRTRSAGGVFPTSTPLILQDVWETQRKGSFTQSMEHNFPSSTIQLHPLHPSKKQVILGNRAREDAMLGGGRVMQQDRKWVRFGPSLLYLYLTKVPFGCIQGYVFFLKTKTKVT